MIKFYGAIFKEGSVKVALEMMDVGSLKDVVKLASLDPAYDERSKKPCVPEAVAAKII